MLRGKTILVTGAAHRLGKVFGLARAHAGADVVLHHTHSDEEALLFLLTCPGYITGEIIHLDGGRHLV